ncbi:MAG: G5 domain-containing protein [Anaerolineaceae bacterium]|nr:G5 domain-containing protein [Anaerolineaceae bacterium]
MNNRQSARHFCRVIVFLIFAVLMLSGCTEIRNFYKNESSLRSVDIYADNMHYITEIDANATVSEALESVGVQTGSQDIVTPALPLKIPLSGEIRVIRVTAEDVVSEQTVPFQSQTVLNESLPNGETRIIQQGQNGERQIVTRYTYEDGMQTGKAVVSVITVKEPVPEILMRGAKAEYAPIKINGRLIYISDGNAWMMEGSTENRTPLVSTGDLDGRVLDLSSDGRWLMFSRTGRSTEVNGLWMLDISDWTAEPISLRVSNVLHFASWLPGSTRRFVYSTVEPSDQAPGWKAVNDLRMQFVSDTGMLMSQEEILESDSNGTYSWWGTEFSLSEDARQLLFATPESIGIIDRLSGEKRELIHFTAYEKTRSDWAWIPGFCWNADNTGLYFTYHGKTNGDVQTYDPTDYHIAFYDLNTGDFRTVIENAGLFSYPAVSPVFSNGKSYLSWLQTELPQQVESERYRIMISDPNGENAHIVYPAQGSSGYITPQHLTWAPGSSEESAWIAFLTNGNIWLVNPFAGISNQITSDGTITKFIWE